MKIYFIRHGHPDYATDSLTELGHKQAEAVAERLSVCGIEKIFSSIRGRAIETAEHTAKKLGLNIIPCRFIRELAWASPIGEPILENGHPWNVSKALISEGRSMTERNWQFTYPYSKSKVVKYVADLEKELDEWLLEFGYKREGEYYRVVGNDTDKTVAMFSHAGSSSAAMSHMFNIPFPQFCGALHMDFTSITIVELSNETGDLVCPKLKIFNDAKHIEGITTENVFGN